MALYSYQALSKDGKRVSGNVDAASPNAARTNLVKMGLYPVKISPMTSAGGRWSWRLLFVRRVSIRDKIFFTKQLALLLKSGVPLLQALDLLVDQTEGSLRTIVIALRDNIKEGRTLADSLEAYPQVFDATYTQLVRAGEASGKLETILNRLTTYLERREVCYPPRPRSVKLPSFSARLYHADCDRTPQFCGAPYCRNVCQRKRPTSFADPHASVALLAHEDLLPSAYWGRCRALFLAALVALDRSWPARY